MSTSPIIQAWQEKIRTAHANKTPLHLRGSGSKDFYGPQCEGEHFDVRENSGIVEYEPSELVVVVKGGTTLRELEKTLAERKQFLAFEPPHFGPDSTIAGAIATGLAGPRRATAGALKDFVLGVKIVDGLGQHLNFGGQVMKNVAGYDVSRLIAGSFGCLGIIDELSIKVLPIPEESATLALSLSQADALHQFNTLGGLPLPLSATAWYEDKALIRLCGAPEALQPAIARIGGERLSDEDANALWTSIRDQRHEWFSQQASTAPNATLWRFAVPATTPVLNTNEPTFIEWGGAVRWVYSTQPEAQIRQTISAVGGNATAFRVHGEVSSPFQPLVPPMLRIQQRLKHAFDPAGILNAGRIYPGAL